MDLTKKFIKNTSIVYREEEDGAFLFDPETGNLKYMNQSAKKAFLMLNGQNDVNQLVQSIVDLYPDTHIKQIRNDVGTFLEQLVIRIFIYRYKLYINFTKKIYFIL